MPRGHSIYAVTNIRIEIVMYIQIFILAKAAFFRGNSAIQFNYKKTRTNKTRDVFG